MKTTNNATINHAWAVQILNENNNQLDAPYDSIKEYAKYCAENDPTFFTWLFGSEGDVSDYGQGMTDEQREAYDNFIAEL